MSTLQKKICMLGSFSVGKTSLVRRFVERIFSDTYQTTIGVRVDKKVVRVSGQEVSLVLWDIHGEDAFQKIKMSYLRGMSGYLLVADGTRKQTLEDALSLNTRVTEIMAHIPAVLVLNKYDLADQWELAPEKEASLVASGWKIFRTSAKNGDSVEQAFSSLASSMLEK